MKSKKTYYKYNQLPVAWKILCYKHAKELGYKAKEIERLEFALEDGKIVGTLDKYLLADYFSI